MGSNVSLMNESIIIIDEMIYMKPIIYDEPISDLTWAHFHNNFS